MRPRQRLAGIEVLCAAFEAQWREGHQPRIEDFQSSLPVEERRALLCKLLHIEWRSRETAGDPPRFEEYAGRFAQEVALVDAAWRRWRDVAPGRATPAASAAAADRAVLEGTLAKAQDGATVAPPRPAATGRLAGGEAQRGQAPATDGTLRLLIYDNQQLVCAEERHGPVELGRQCLGEEPPYSAVERAGQTRIIIAAIDDTSVSRRYVLCERVAGQVRITNLSDTRSINLTDHSRLKPGLKRLIDPKQMLVLGSRVVRFELPG
jgi:hypothetical protein